MIKHVQRGEIYYADLLSSVGSEQSGTRPVLIVQNDIGNYYSPTTIVSMITSKTTKPNIPTHIQIEADGLTSKSVVLTEQIRTLDKQRLGPYICRLNRQQMEQIDHALMISLELQ